MRPTRRDRSAELAAHGLALEGTDVFGRTEAERVLERRKFERTVAEAGVEEMPVERGAERYSPGEGPKRFYATKPKKAPTTETEKQVLAALKDAPLDLGYISNSLIYARPVSRLSVRAKQAVWSLVRGGAAKLLRTYRPDSYWIGA